MRRGAVWLTLAAGAATAVAACGGSSPTSTSTVAWRTSTPAPTPKARVVSYQVQYLPHGVQTVAAGDLPGSRRFSIVVQRYRLGPKVDVSVVASTTPDRPSKRPELTPSSSTSFNPSQTPGVLAFEGITVCSPRAPMFVYGLLRTPADSALLSVDGATRPFARATLPADLHVSGAVVYGLVPPHATLLVRSPSGATVQSAPLTVQSTAACAPGAAVGFFGGR